MTVEANIDIFDNADWAIPLVFTDEWGVPYDLTGSTFKMEVKVNADADASLTLTTANGGIVSTDLANGAIALAIADFALPPGDYLYDLLRLAGASREMLMFGALSCTKGQTQ